MSQYAVIDVETTGGSVADEKVTEFCCHIYDGEKVIDRFATLVNPERPIPYYISRLTGITDDMVANAPKFYEIAERIVKLTEGKIFVAHNSQFDYGFIRNEFSSLGFNFERDTLCTCRFARKIFPGHGSYSLGNLCRDFGIINRAAHRAEGDVEATVQLLQLLLKDCYPEQLLLAIKPFTEPDLSEFLRSDMIKTLPEKTGVYYFLDSDKNIIYIGKSNNIRKRVISHFKNKSAGKTARMRILTKDISFDLTGNELIALLLESSEIKKHQPLFNRAQKKKEFTTGIFERKNGNGYSVFYIDEKGDADEAVALFKSPEEAVRMLERKIYQFNLCNKLCGIEKENGSVCFNYQLKKCNGACSGFEDVDMYNERVAKAISTFKYDHPDFILVDKGRNYEEKSVVLVEKGRFKGFGFLDASQSWNTADEIRDCIQHLDDHPDIERILLSRIKRKKYEKLILLQKEEMHENIYN